jgi:NADH-quinone oxidoreductase subunit L
MMLGIGAGSYVAGLFHLTTHAFFKALLFLGSGSVIHALHVHHNSHAHDHNSHAHNHNSHAHNHGHDHNPGHNSDHEHDHSHNHAHTHEASFESFGIPAEQDMRQMGGLRHKMPTTFLTMLIATLSIAGVPFLFSGFWSKDAILGGVLERAMEWNSVHYYLLFCMALSAAGLTAFYMFRLIFMTFAGQPRNQEMHNHAHESPKSMVVPLVILAILSFPIVNKWSFEAFVKAPEQPHVHSPRHAMRGNQNQPLLIAQAGVSDAEHGEHATTDAHTVEGEHGHSPAHTIAMILSIIVAGTGILVSALFYHWKTFSAEAVAARFRSIYKVLWNKYYFDEFYNGVLVAFTVWGARVLGWIDLRGVDGIVNGVAFVTRAAFSKFIGWFDNTFVDGMVNWVAKITWGVGGRVRRVQTGMIQNYLLIVLGGVVLLILIFRRLL